MSLDATGAAGNGIWTIIQIVFAVAAIAGCWTTFVKAGEPGWGALIPFYNVYLMIRIAGRPGWWLVLYFIPLVNIVAWLFVAIDIARNFGKGTGFGLLLWFVPSIMFLILGFGSARFGDAPAARPAYAGSGGASGGASAMTSGPSYLPPVTTTSSGQRVEAAPLVAPPSGVPGAPAAPRPPAPPA